MASILLITDGDGNAKEKRHFDAWGKTVKITDGSNNVLNKLTFFDRGYTGHEHLQGVNLIHMNGRLYDPNLKRFLSPDNYIQDITNTQNYNRYGYVLNNPLMYVDPSGEYGEYPPGRQPGYDYQRSLDNAVSGPQIDFRGFREWTTKNIWKPIQKMQPGKWIKGWFTKRSSDVAPVEYSNYEGLSSDPLAGSSASTQNASFSAGGTESGGLGISKSITKQLWDLNGDYKLSKLEADIWWLIGDGKPITVDNSKIDWTGLEMDSRVEINNPFSISTTEAFKNLPFETAATYGGTSFVRAGINTAEVKDQLYHYGLRDWKSVENIRRNIMNEVGNPATYINAKGKDYMIHYRNPTIKFNSKFDIHSYKYIPGVRGLRWDEKLEKTIFTIK